MPKHALRGAPLYVGGGKEEADVAPVFQGKQCHAWHAHDGNNPTSVHVEDPVLAAEMDGLCSLLYDSWGGDPPLGRDDMLLFESWRCRTLAMRALGVHGDRRGKQCSTSLHCIASTDANVSAPAGKFNISKLGDASTDSIIPTDHCGYSGVACLKGAMRHQAELRRVGFKLVKEALPTGVPMDLVERTAWSECLAFFCKQEFFQKGKCTSPSDRSGISSILRPVALPALVDRLSLRLWFLSPVWASAGPVGNYPPCNQMPGWLSFFCEEIGAFFLFLLLHMRLVLQQGDPQYLHLTDKEWNARFKHVSWLLSSQGPVRAFSYISPVASEMKGSQEARSVELCTNSEKSVLLGCTQGSDGLIPSFEDIEPANSFHFPPNKRTCPHEYWLLYDRVRYSWLVCDETAVIGSFPVLETDTPTDGYSLKILSSLESGNGAPNGKYRRPGGSLVRAAQKDALRFLTILGATNYISDLDVEDTFLTDLLNRLEISCTATTTSASNADRSNVHFSTPISGNKLEEGKRKTEASICSNDSSPTPSDIPCPGKPPEKQSAQLLEPSPSQWEQSMARWADFRLQEFNGEEPMQKRRSHQPVQIVENATVKSMEGMSENRATRVHTVDSCRAVVSHNRKLTPPAGSCRGAAGNKEDACDKGAPLPLHGSDELGRQGYRGPNVLPFKEIRGHNDTVVESESSLTTENTTSTGRLGRETNGRKYMAHRHSKRCQPETESKGLDVKRAKRLRGEEGEPTIKHKDDRTTQEQKEVKRLLGSQLDRMEISGGRVLIGLRHRNTLIDRRLTAFARAFFRSNEERKPDAENGSVGGPVTLQQCVRALQKYMAEHCKPLKKAYVCDSTLKDLTGKESLPQRKDALVYTLKSLHLIEYFMIDPRELRGTG